MRHDSKHLNALSQWSSEQAHKESVFPFLEKESSLRDTQSFPLNWWMPEPKIKQNKTKQSNPFWLQRSKSILIKFRFHSLINEKLQKVLSSMMRRGKEFRKADLTGWGWSITWFGGGKSRSDDTAHLRRGIKEWSPPVGGPTAVGGWRRKGRRWRQKRRYGETGGEEKVKRRNRGIYPLRNPIWQEIDQTSMLHGTSVCFLWQLDTSDTITSDCPGQWGLGEAPGREPQRL